MKKYLIALALVTIMPTVQAMDQQEPNELSSVNTLELNDVFDLSQIENIHALELSNIEMEDTKGAFVPFIPVAVAVGSRFVTSQVVKHYISSGSLAYGTFTASRSLKEMLKK
ncbi:hypothetical protein [Acinetobacter sp. 1125_18A]|uniref:hypothetical protein n=1 Tax=Acinetobacter sp. 1125_18A TaxID=2605959 RepID=UPI0040580A8B